MISKNVKIFSVTIVTISAIASIGVLCFTEPTGAQVVSSSISLLGAGIVYAMAGLF